MTSYSAIANSEIDQDSPVTEPLLTKIRDNPIAISEGATGAPIDQAMWHPYDSTAVSDGNDGLIYDHAVDGTVSTIVSPDFVDGYEYLFLVEGLSYTLGASSNLTLEFYEETNAAYSGATTLGTSTVTTSSFYGFIHVIGPRRVQKAHFAHHCLALVASAGSLGSAQNSTAVNVDATAQKILRVRFDWSAGDNDGGKIWMYRRRFVI